jgi:serine-type D-Ala-D-Ala carboxypeptidase (penicillin-binding protein 5/6)
MFLRSTSILSAICALLLALGVPATAQSVQITVPVAYLYDVTTRSVLFAKGADDLVPPASLIKLMTAEVVFDALKRGEITPETEYQVTEPAWRKGGAPSRSAAMSAALNSRIAVRDLLQGLIVMSANDAALVLAEGMVKSEDAFTLRMQERAKAIGLTRSQIRNPTGFTHPDQRVSAREMAQIAVHLFNTYPDHMALFAQREFTWNSIRQTNRNPLLAMGIGADGMQTGNLADSGFNLVGSAVQDGRRLIVVVMGADAAEKRSAEARRLLEWGFRNFEQKKLLERGVVLGEAQVTGGVRTQVALGLKDDISFLMPKAVQDTVTTRIVYNGPLRAPVAAGTEMGRLTVLRGTVIALEVPVMTLESVEQGSLRRRALDNLWGWFGSFLPQRAAKS